MPIAERGVEVSIGSLDSDVAKNEPSRTITYIYLYIYIYRL